MLAARLKYSLETDYINNLFESGTHSLVVTKKMSLRMRELRVDVVDINHVLCNGRVVRSDMLESRGLWDVRGNTTEGITLEVSVAVISSEYEIELLEIVTIERRRR